jgi:hypothetical protein
VQGRNDIGFGFESKKKKKKRQKRRPKHMLVGNIKLDLREIE